MKLALFGPGFGHNIEPFLDHFNSKTSIECDFYYHGMNSFNKKYTGLNYFSIKKNLIQFVSNVSKYDVIWLMGGGKLMYLLYILLYFRKKKSTTVIHIWGEQLPLRAISNNLYGKITSNILRTFDIINCNWYGTADILRPNFKDKVQVNVLGLSDLYFNPPENIDPEIIKMMSLVDETTYNFYYPKSFLSVSRHDLVVEAVNILRNRSLDNFKVYFTEGNANNIERQNEIRGLIHKYDLQEYIIILDRVKYFDTQNFNLLWGKMDCGLQIAQHDQLSNTIFEPLINKKELIISNIAPYQYIEEFFGFHLELTNLDMFDLALAMENKITLKSQTSDSEKELILNLIKERYTFKTNFETTFNKVLNF